MKFLPGANFAEALAEFRARSAGAELAMEDEMDQQYRAADREIAAIQRQEDNDDLNRLFTSRSPDDYKGAKDRYLSLLMEKKADERRERYNYGDYADGDDGFFGLQMVTPADAKGGVSERFVYGARDKMAPTNKYQKNDWLPGRFEDYDDPYSDITGDVRGRVDELLNRASDIKNERSAEDRQNAITGLVTKLTGGRPNYSAIREQIKTPSYESYMGGGNSIQRAGRLMQGVRDAAEERRPQEQSLLDQLIAKIRY